MHTVAFAYTGKKT